MEFGKSHVLFMTIFSLPYWLYVFIWTQPGAFLRWSNGNFRGVRTTKVFELTAHALKFCQLFAFIAWCVANQQDDLSFALVPIWAWVVAMLAIAAGQVLNIAVYRALGLDGVYYGVKLGYPIPWYQGFPFNVVPHPQYVGAVLSYWGVALVTYFSISTSIATITVSIPICYIVVGLVEQYL
jgi:hypothetical protein